ncbi:MAG: hypothetical protein AVDCRST_MAG72-1772 [uncultured Nocardioidaceae bacterium]|uniref:Integral membrane protein n=1 Tax=uncultured Nocardioidaceae bacterium TaxID=253824 RepID=A0A6J4MDC5_9ACTN|nr:MAG: hypothetical protein AVDCRST_MAG72-1772 [uncultured Nocardioidaceae bacterium]
MSGGSSELVAATEKWFLRHGLPYFVESERRIAQRGLRARRVATVAAVAAVVGLAAGGLVGWWLNDKTNATGAALAAALSVLGWYAVTTLRLGAIGSWAILRTTRSIGLLFPLVTRALPLLLLFITFLFINAEVWQVASSLDGGVLWLSVMLFTAVACGFLLVRLPEELDRVDQEMGHDRLVAACSGTPLEPVAGKIAAEHTDLAGHTQVTGFQRANLILVLLVSQLVQVVMLSISVFLFFLVFGAVTMQPSVIESWIGDLPRAVPQLPTLSLELLQVSVFLAAFSGLYFTVYAVTDQTYRDQFFTSLTNELEQAVGVRAVYRSLQPEATS